MAEENIIQELRLKNTDKTRNHLSEGINWNGWMSKNHKKFYVNYIEHFLILGSTITWYVSFSTFSNLIGIPIGITSSAIGLRICAITTTIKKYKSIIKRKKTKHDKIVLLAKSKLNSIEVNISKFLINSVISHDQFVLIYNILKEYNKMKEEIKKFKGLIKFMKDLSLFMKLCYHITWV